MVLIFTSLPYLSSKFFTKLAIPETDFTPYPGTPSDNKYTPFNPGLVPKAFSRPEEILVPPLLGNLSI